MSVYPSETAAKAGPEKPVYLPHFRSAPRPGASVDTLSLGQLGHMLDTLKDGVLIMRHIGANAKTNPEIYHAERFHNQQGVPSYIERIASDLRTGPTFNRSDKRHMEPKTWPDLAAFMNSIHAQMRADNLRMGKIWVIPESVKDAINQYDALTQEYLQLVKATRPEPTKPVDHHHIPSDQLANFEQRFKPVSEQMFKTLRALPSVEIEVDGKRYNLPNTPVNQELKDSTPALLFFWYRFLGSGGADKNKRPAKLEYHKKMGSGVIGIGSNLTDSVQGLLDVMKAQGVPMESFDIDHDAVGKLVQKYQRSFQLALAFCRTIDCGYPAMYEDLERFIRMGGGTPELTALKNPPEAAMMLYAVERRLAREGQSRSLRHRLRQYADQVALCGDLPQAQETLGSDTAFQTTLKQVAYLSDDYGFSSAQAMIALLQHTFPSVQKLPTLQPNADRVMQLRSQNSKDTPQAPL